LAAINVGTSAALRIMCAGPVAKAPFGLFCYRVDTERYLVGGAVSNAGNLRAWCLRELQQCSPEQLEIELADRPGPEHGLTVLPFWTAERAPTWNEDLRGSILGITQATTSIDLLQAITEATYHRLALIAELLISSSGQAPKFFVSGGIQNSQTALQRLTDVLNHPLYANPEPEASIRGAAIYAMEKLSLPVAPLEKTRPLQPRKGIAHAYRDARKKQVTLEHLLERHWKH
jgi:gluconokinase